MTYEDGYTSSSKTFHFGTWKPQTSVFVRLIKSVANEGGKVVTRTKRFESSISENCLLYVTFHVVRRDTEIICKLYMKRFMTTVVSLV